MQPHQTQDLEQHCEENLEFKELCKLHFDAFLLVLALVFLTGCKKWLLQELHPYVRSQLYCPTLKQNANSLNKMLVSAELMIKPPLALDRCHLSPGCANTNSGKLHSQVEHCLGFFKMHTFQKNALYKIMNLEQNKCF